MREGQEVSRGSLFPFALAGLIGISPATLLWPLWLPDQRSYLLTNKIDPDFPMQLVPYFAASLLAVGAIYARRFLRQRPRNFSTLVEVTRACNARLVVLLACPLISGLLATGPSGKADVPFFTLALIASTAVVGGVVGYRWGAPTARGRAEPTGRYRWSFGLFVTLAAAAAYSVAFSCFSILNLHRFVVPSFDLAIYDNLLWNTSHGDFLATSLIKGGTHMGAHFDPLLVALVPFYLISPRAETLLVLQSVWLASGAIPLYLLSSRVLRGAAAAMVIAGAYLLHPALHGINLYEFHSLAMVVPLIIWCLYFLERDSAKGYWIFLALILLTREDMSLLSCGIGVFAADAMRRPKRGLITIACALLYFVSIKTFVMAESGVFMSGSGDSYDYSYYFQQMIPFEGGGIRDLLLTIFTNPIFTLRVVLEEAKLFYLGLILLPCCFLSLFAPRAWQLLGYGFVFCLLASVQGPHSIYTQYSSVLLPFAMALAPYGIARLSHSRFAAAARLEPARVRRALIVAVAVAASMVSWKFGALVKNDSFRIGNLWQPAHFRSEALDSQRIHYEAAARLIELIPRNASVSATRYLMPLVSNRQVVRHDVLGWDLDYMLIRLDSLSPQGRAKFEERLRRPQYEEVAREAGIVLIKRVGEVKPRRSRKGAQVPEQ